MYSNKIKKLREFFKMNQSEFSKFLSISQPSYSRIESGKAEISADSLRILFVEKGISPLWFFYDIDPMVFPFPELDKSAVSKLLQKELILEKIFKKILIEKERNLWGFMFGVDSRLRKGFYTALTKDFTSVPLGEAKISLIKSIEAIRIPLLTNVNVFEIDKKKLVEIIDELKELEAFTILQNAKEIIGIIDSSRMDLD